MTVPIVGAPGTDVVGVAATGVTVAVDEATLVPTALVAVTEQL